MLAYFPVPQSTQADAPVLTWYVPDGQIEQLIASVAPVVLWYDPNAHCVQFSADVKPYPL